MTCTAKNATQVAYPLEGSEGFVKGWYKFTDKYLCPEVIYGSWPPATTIKIGGRSIQVDRAVPVKLRLLEPEEDFEDWVSKKQHRERVDLGEYHCDFGDVQVAYSFSSPQTHMWFCGYSLHFACLENLALQSYNATVNIQPEHLLPLSSAPKDILEFAGSQKTFDMSQQISHQRNGRNGILVRAGGRGAQADSTAAQGAQQLFSDVQPVYFTSVPQRVDTLGRRYRVDYYQTPEHLNDCERDIRKIENYDGVVGISQYAQPASRPPIFPPNLPHEYDEFIQKPPKVTPYFPRVIPPLSLQAKNTPSRFIGGHQGSSNMRGSKRKVKTGKEGDTGWTSGRMHAGKTNSTRKVRTGVTHTGMPIANQEKIQTVKMNEKSHFEPDDCYRTGNYKPTAFRISPLVDLHNKPSQVFLPV